MAVSLEYLLDYSTQRLHGVHPRIKDYALELVQRAYDKGINVVITSGLRTMAGQALLYGQGRASYVYQGKQYGNPKLPIVTQAKPGSSIHNYGLAIDFALRTESGDIVWDTKRDANFVPGSDWFEVGKIGKEMGFEWGGDWTKFKDYPHFQWDGGLSLAQLAKGSRPSIPPVTRKTWIEKGDVGAKVLDLQQKLNRIKITVEEDGIFGAGMETAAKKFQTAHNLAVDGLFGVGSMAKLDSLLKVTAAKPASPPPPAKVVYPTYPSAVSDRLGEINIKAATAYRRLPDTKSEVISTLKAGHKAHFYEIKGNYLRLGIGWVPAAAAEITRDYAKEKADAGKKGEAGLEGWKRDELAVIYQKAHADGIFDSPDHAKQVKDGSMPLEQMVYLNAVLLGALLNDGKRLR